MARVVKDELQYDMKDFDLSFKKGGIRNRQDEVRYTMMKNANAALRIKAAKKLKKDTNDNREIDSYVSKVNEAIKKDMIPDKVYLQVMNDHINELQNRANRLLSKKDMQKGKLAKSEQHRLDELEKNIAIEKEQRDEWIKENRKGKKDDRENKPIIDEDDKADIITDE